MAVCSVVHKWWGSKIEYMHDTKSTHKTNSFYIIILKRRQSFFFLLYTFNNNRDKCMERKQKAMKLYKRKFDKMFFYINSDHSKKKKICIKDICLRKQHVLSSKRSSIYVLRF